jgi:hypothetical protein
MQIYTRAVPTDSEIASFADTADFADCYAAANPWPELSAMAIFMKTVGNTPGWVNALMSLRNRVVALFGLKNLGSLGDVRPATDYRLGERVGIFTLLFQSEEEIVLGDLDKHLEARVSVRKMKSESGAALIAVSTAVHEHNLLGKIYMLFVGPVHKIIVPAVLRRGL